MPHVEKWKGRERTAYHESAHAVCAFHADWPIAKVTCKAEVLTAGRWPALGHVAWGKGEFNDYWTGLIAAVGPVAEARRFNEPFTVIGGSADSNIVLKHLRDSGLGDDADWLKAGNDLQAEAEAFVSRHWCQIERVAQELLRRRTLSGGQIRKILSTGSKGV